MNTQFVIDSPNLTPQTNTPITQDRIQTHSNSLTPPLLRTAQIRTRTPDQVNNNNHISREKY